MRKQILAGVPFVVLVIFVLCGLSQAQLPGDAPGVPTGLKAVISGKNARLTWKAPSEYPERVTGYEIVRASLASGPFGTVGKVGPDVHQFLDTGVRPEVIYFYKIRAVGKEEASPFSHPASIEISGVR
jgi:hypothetical protein